MQIRKHAILAQHCQTLIDRSDSRLVFSVSDLRRLSNSYLGNVRDAAKDARIIRAMHFVQLVNRHSVERIDVKGGPLWLVLKDQDTRHFAQSIGLIH